jgi:hypothetical protein
MAQAGGNAPTEGRSAELRVGCILNGPHGDVRVLEIGRRDLRVRLESTREQKRYLLSHLQRFVIVEDVDRTGQWGEMLKRLSQVRPYHCDRCDTPLSDLVSIAIGRGPGCRSRSVASQRRRADAGRRTAMESGDYATLALMDDEEAARTVISIWDLKD